MMSTSYENYGGVKKNSSSMNHYEDENVFDEDVQRFEADSYREKYGDRWKKLASSVRDVVQPDGSIVREYVIEDPSLLDQLSDNDDLKSIIDNSQNTSRNFTSNKSQSDARTMSSSSSTPKYNENPFNFQSQMTINNQKQLENSFNNSNNQSQCILSRNKSSSSMSNIYESEYSNQNEDKKFFQPIITSQISNDEEYDKEVESIHKQGILAFVKQNIQIT